MKRAAAAAVLIALAIVVAGAGGGRPDASYWLEVDNAFGLVEGSDVKIAGVRAGIVGDIVLDERDMRALVGLKLTQPGYDELRRDVSCETRPQSLIGEYFVTCEPGRGEPLPEGATIPVTRTSTTVPMDLVNNIMRRPYRERFTIIFNELGGALAARGDDLNETIRRASPALREVDRVLATLRRERKTLGQLTVDADRILADLAVERDELNRFVRETADTTQIAAERTRPLATGIRRLPRFLAELKPTFDVLGRTAARQEQAIRTLDANRGHLRGFLERLGPFSEKSRPALRTLADAARPGRTAIAASLPRVRELRTAVRPLPELSNNLAITLEHLDDRRFAAEPDKRTPDGKGLTGLEALLRFVYVNSQGANFVDANNYIGKINLLVDHECGSYADPEKVIEDRANDRCRGWLGPNQPGVTTPDPSAEEPSARRRSKRPAKPGRRAPERPGETPSAAPQAPAPEATPPPRAPPALLPNLDEIVDELLPSTGLLPDEVDPILDYLLGG